MVVSVHSRTEVNDSFYAFVFLQGAQSLVTLLQEAMRYIPKHLHKSTPMALKATAGLRLLPKEESTALLEAVRQLFKNYPFRVFDDSVEIMGGMDEGE